MIAVRWMNPVIGVAREREFATREDAEAYIAGRRRKYGRFPGFQPPIYVSKHGTGDVTPDIRRSYRGLTALPAVGLFDASGALIATCRARNLTDARDLFRRYVERMPELAAGHKVRRIDA